PPLRPLRLCGESYLEHTQQNKKGSVDARQSPVYYLGALRTTRGGVWLMKNSEPEKDYYSILGAGRDASREEIERRYKQLAQQHHPDRGGDEEEMKSLNEAWRVLGDQDSRRTYDAGRARTREVYRSHAPVSSPGAKADPVSGRIVGAMLCVLLGLVLLLLVRAHYVVFLWPLALLAAGIVLFGILMAHGALTFARETVGPKHFARRFVWAQEVVFWSCVAGGGYIIYFLLTAI
ncbi:MAG TPA: J domain-containing protein, partial [Pyrinomonadaceae bacterium]|nr:J domain-containing protein [Pyrinomonadaceae bacterium]